MQIGKNSFRSEKYYLHITCSEKLTPAYSEPAYMEKVDCKAKIKFS